MSHTPLVTVRVAALCMAPTILACSTPPVEGDTTFEFNVTSNFFDEVELFDVCTDAALREYIENEETPNLTVATDV